MSPDSKSPVGRRGLILILSSPSGAGKTTLTRSLVEERAGVLSVSVTTRPKRPSEIEGKHYHFIDVEEFKAMRDRDELDDLVEAARSRNPQERLQLRKRLFDRIEIRTLGRQKVGSARRPARWRLGPHVVPSTPVGARSAPTGVHQPRNFVCFRGAIDPVSRGRWTNRWTQVTLTSKVAAVAAT